MKKYVIRIVGALCILSAMALLFLLPCVQLDGVSRKELRTMREDVTGVLEQGAESLYAWLDSDMKDDLKDYDLPSTKAGIKKRFREAKEIATSVFDGDVSLKELLSASVAAPGLITDMESLMQTDYANLFFKGAGSYAMNIYLDDYSYADLEAYAEQLQTMAVDIVDMLSSFTFVVSIVTVVLIALLILGLASAVTNICNRGRWLKYLLLILVLLLTVSFCILSSMSVNIFEEFANEAPMLEGAVLTVGLAPIFSCVLLIVPVILDVIFERKTR